MSQPSPHETPAVRTASEIARTAYAVAQGNDFDPKGGLYLGSKKSAKTCPCCKGQDTAQGVIDTVRLEPYKTFYTSPFEVLECTLCGAEWSIFYPGEERH